MLSEADEQRVVRAIANAERENRSEVRVHIERRCPTKDPLQRAKVLYRVLKLHATRDDTGVLLYVASQSRCAAVWSGAGVHPRADDGFWHGVVEAVAQSRASAGVEGNRSRVRPPSRSRRRTTATSPSTTRTRRVDYSFKVG